MERKHGVLFTGGAAPRRELAERYVYPFDVVVSADSGLETAELFGVHSDMILGDMDSLDSERRLDKYSASSIRRAPRDKDSSDTQLGLAELKRQQCSYITLIGGGDGRIDHLFAIRDLFAGALHPHRWICRQEAVFFVGAGAEDGLSFPSLELTGLVPSDPVSVFPAAAGAPAGTYAASSAGLEWPLSPVRWEDGSSSLSNRVRHGTDTVRVTAETGGFIVVFPLDSRIHAEHVR